MVKTNIDRKELDRRLHYLEMDFLRGTIEVWKLEKITNKVIRNLMNVQSNIIEKHNEDRFYGMEMLRERPKRKPLSSSEVDTARKEKKKKMIEADMEGIQKATIKRHLKPEWKDK